jgi:hypothetical protein
MFLMFGICHQATVGHGAYTQSKMSNARIETQSFAEGGAYNRLGVAIPLSANHDPNLSRIRSIRYVSTCRILIRFCIWDYIRVGFLVGALCLKKRGFGIGGGSNAAMENRYKVMSEQNTKTKSIRLKRHKSLIKMVENCDAAGPLSRLRRSTLLIRRYRRLQTGCRQTGQPGSL